TGRSSRRAWERWTWPRFSWSDSRRRTTCASPPCSTRRAPPSRASSCANRRRRPSPSRATTGSPASARAPPDSASRRPTTGRFSTATTTARREATSPSTSRWPRPAAKDPRLLLGDPRASPARGTGNARLGHVGGTDPVEHRFDLRVEGVLLLERPGLHPGRLIAGDVGFLRFRPVPGGLLRKAL